MPRPLHAPLVAATILAAALSLPAAAQTGGDGLNDLARPAPAQPSPTAGVCERNYNLLRIMIDPGIMAIPVWVRPFTGQDETAPEILALYDRCADAIPTLPPLVSWTASGPGMKPIGSDVEPVQQRPERPRLDNQTR